MRSTTSGHSLMSWARFTNAAAILDDVLYSSSICLIAGLLCRTDILRRSNDFTLSSVDALASRCILIAMGRFANTRLARMSSGRYCLIRDLGLVNDRRSHPH
jgi:hypothetical protein